MDSNTDDSLLNAIEQVRQLHPLLLTRALVGGWQLVFHVPVSPIHSTMLRARLFSGRKDRIEMSSVNPEGNRGKYDETLNNGSYSFFY